MFNPKEWIERSWNDEDTKIVKIAGEDANIRRLKGTQWEQYIRAVHGRSEESAVVVVLQHGLVNAKGFGSYTYDEMVKFYDACPTVADRLADLILKHTMQCMEAEQAALEDAEKNSETTHTKPSSDDGAESMDKTPNSPESADEN